MRISTKEALASHYGVSITTVRNWHRRGLKAGKRGYDTANIDRFLEGIGSPAAPSRQRAQRARAAKSGGGGGEDVADLAEQKLRAEVAKLQTQLERERIRTDRERRGYIELAFGVLAELVIDWKRQIEGWVDQAVLLVPAGRRGEVKRLLDEKLDGLFAEMSGPPAEPRTSDG